MRIDSARERRLIAILILVAVVALVWLGLLRPLFDGFSARAHQRAALREQNEQAVRVAARLPRLRAEAARLRERAGRYLLPTTDRERAVALLRERIRALAMRHQIVIKSVQEVDADAGLVRVRADGTFQIEQLTAFLKQLQDQGPVVVVSSMTVAADTAFETGHAGPLGVRIEVSSAYQLAPQH